MVMGWYLYLDGAIVVIILILGEKRILSISGKSKVWEVIAVAGFKFVGKSFTGAHGFPLY
ncbi:hypothetical protein GLO73106DRAFT_00028750 [Gloeocapsa sp. PCC 73106]|nr:hypothetical protein GLO73106DRAFT_00028750 [Gloeocapsa sp. PCC 73106]